MLPCRPGHFYTWLERDVIEAGATSERPRVVCDLGHAGGPSLPFDTTCREDCSQYVLPIAVVTAAVVVSCALATTGKPLPVVCTRT
jgi:hypothetical protein